MSDGSCVSTSMLYFSSPLVLFLRGGGVNPDCVFVFLLCSLFLDLKWCQQTFIEKRVKKQFFAEVQNSGNKTKASRISESAMRQ